MSTESTNNEDEFQKEIVDLFRQEAQDWLVQIDAALTELEGHPDLDRHTQLVDALVRAVASLGGSAATINLAEVERATFAMLPFIDLVRDRTTTTPQDFATIRQQFAVVQHAVCDATGSTLPDMAQVGESAADDALDLLGHVQALRALETSEDRTGPCAAHLIAEVIRRLEREATQGRTTLDPHFMTGMLEELTRADDELLEDLQQALPVIRRAVAQLERPACSDGPREDLTPVLGVVDRLHGRAQRANAVPIVTFLGGLSRFLTLMMQRRLTIASSTLDTLGIRLTALLAMTKEWVERGRQERTAIASLPPAAR